MQTGNLRRTITRVSGVVVLLLSISCSTRSPITPSSDPAVVAVDAALVEAWAAVDRPVPGRVRHVVVADLPYSADWHVGTGTIRIGRHVLGSPTVIVAGVIVHELSHADGFEHSCGEIGVLTDDLTLQGPWGHQADFLARNGRGDIASLIRREHICSAVR